MADLCIQDLTRLSHLPDNPGNPAELIAGQKYYDVEFTGGSISGLTLDGVDITNSTINSSTIGATTPSTAAFTTVSATGQITSTLATGTPPFVVASTTRVSNLNVAQAGVADTVTVADAAGDTTTFPMLAGSATGNLPPLSDTGLTYNATTKNLSTTTFTGDLTGTATQVSVANEASDTTCFPTFVTAATGNLAVKSNAGLTYNSSTNNLAATTFTGSFSGTATTATNVTVANEAADTTCFPLFATAATGDLPPKSNASLTFNSSTGALGATTLGGTLTTAAQTNVTSLGTLTGLTMGGTLAMGANSITMTGSLAATGARATKGWFTDIESTNAATINGTAATGSGGYARATQPTLVAPIMAAGTTSLASQVLTSGTNLTTATAGSTEYDGKVQYFTPQGTQRGAVTAAMEYRLDSALAGSNVNTAQSFLGVGVTVSASTVYEFEGFFALSKSAGTTSHNTALLFGGTATINNIGYECLFANNTTSLTTLTNWQVIYIQTAASTTIATGYTSANNFDIIRMRGRVSINGAGTFIPQYILSAAPGGAYTTAANSFFRMWPVGAAGANTSIGPWA